MDPYLQRLAMAELDGFVWYKARNGQDAAADYWGVARLAYPPEEGIGKAWLGCVGESRHMTPDEIADAKRTRGFYTYAPEYLKELDAVRRVELKLLTMTEQSPGDCYGYLLYPVYLMDLMRVVYPRRGARPSDDQQLFALITATAAQRVEAILHTTKRWTE